MVRDPHRTLCCQCERPTAGNSRSRCELCGNDLCGMCGHTLDAYSHICGRCVVEEFPGELKEIVAERAREEPQEDRKSNADEIMDKDKLCLDGCGPDNPMASPCVNIDGTTHKCGVVGGWGACRLGVSPARKEPR